MSIQDQLKELLPWYMRGPVGGKIIESMCAVADMGIETQVQGLQQGDPLRCDVSALPLIGQARGLRRYPTESTPSYRRRLAGYREAKRHWGSIYGQISQLQLWFSPQRPRIRAVHQSGDGQFASWHTLESDGSYRIENVTPSNWDWDSEWGVIVDDNVTLRWGRYWIIVYTDELDGGSMIDASVWDGPDVYDSHAIWDGLFSSAQIIDMLDVMRRDNKAAHSHLWGLIFASDPDSFDPSTTSTTEAGLTSTTLPAGNWRQVINPASGDLTRLSTAIFAYDAANG